MVKTQSLVLALCLALFPIAGCAHHVQANIPANAINSTDATLFRTIADFDYFLASLNKDVAAGNLQLSPALHATLIQANKDVTLAKTLGEAYHNGVAIDPLCSSTRLSPGIPLRSRAKRTYARAGGSLSDMSLESFQRLSGSHRRARRPGCQGTKIVIIFPPAPSNSICQNLVSGTGFL